MKIAYVPLIDLLEVSGELDIYDYLFTEMAENDSYIWLDTSPEKVASISEDMVFYKGLGREEDLIKAQNELTLILHLRNNYNFTHGAMFHILY